MSQDTVLVWMLSLNREYTKEVRLSWCITFTILTSLYDFQQQEYDIIYRLQQVAFPNDKQEYKPTNADSFREPFILGFAYAQSFLHHFRPFDDTTSPFAHDATPACSSC